MTTPPSALPPANWYPDPQTPGQLRYWDGQRWTQHVHPVQQPTQGVGGFAPTGGAAQGTGGFAPTGGAAQGALGLGSTGGAAREVGGFTPSNGAARVGASTPTLEGVLSGVSGANAGLGPATAPLAAGPMTGGTFLPTGPAMRTATPGGSPVAGALAGGSITSFQPGAVAGTPGSLRVPTPRDLDREADEEDGSPQPPQALFAFVFGTAALAAAGLALYSPGTPVDEYLPYLGAALGFLSVLLGLVGRRRAIGGLMRGTTESWFGIGAGFLAIGLSSYEYMNPGDIAGRIFGG